MPLVTGFGQLNLIFSTNKMFKPCIFLRAGRTEIAVFTSKLLEKVFGAKKKGHINCYIGDFYNFFFSSNIIRRLHQWKNKII